MFAINIVKNQVDISITFMHSWNINRKSIVQITTVNGLLSQTPSKYGTTLPKKSTLELKFQFRYVQSGTHKSCWRRSIILPYLGQNWENSEGKLNGYLQTNTRKPTQNNQSWKNPPLLQQPKVNHKQKTQKNIYFSSKVRRIFLFIDKKYKIGSISGGENEGDSRTEVRN